MSRSPIVDVLRHYGFENVPQSGGWKPVKCAFHGDRHASASVNPDLGGFRCHTCDISGDAIKIVMEMEQVGFLEAVDKIHEITGDEVLDLPGRSQRGTRSPLRPGRILRNRRRLGR